MVQYVPLPFEGSNAAKLADRLEGLLNAIKDPAEGHPAGLLRTESRYHERHADLAAALHYMVQIRRIEDSLETLSKFIKSETTKWKEEIVPHKFDVARSTSQTVTTKHGDFRFVAGEKLYYSIRSGKNDEAKEWLVENGLKEMITETVNASTLTAAGKDLLKEKGKELPDDLFNSAFKGSLSMTAVKKPAAKKK